MAIATVNPTTGEEERRFDPYPPSEVERRVALAHETFGSYRRTTFEQRARWMAGAADLLDAEAPDTARLLTTEMGKTFAAARAEVSKCANAMRWFAEHGPEIMADEQVKTSAADSRIVYEPMGPVLAVMPWNFPLWQVVRFAAPALMAGNVGLLKHSSNVPQTALLLEDTLVRAGFPPGAFQTLLVGSQLVAGLIADMRVRAVTLTGSEGAGRSVGESAGRALKKSVLELGGSDPFVVLGSADLERAVDVGVQARVQNNGQSCIAAKRFIVTRGIYDEFERRFVDKMSDLVVGDPLDQATDVGPLALERARRDIEEQVEDARLHGASVLCGGKSLDGPGWFYQPTVIAGITPEMRVATEEVFGPVAMMYRAEDTDDAVRIANDSTFGLGASVWTEDPVERREVTAGIEAGMVFVNAMVASMPELPFGGVKDSGYGRELSAHGMHEFCDIKSVWVR